MNDLKRKVSSLWDVGKEDQAFGVVVEHFGHNRVRDALTTNQFQATQDVLSELKERVQEYTYDLSVGNEDTDTPREMLDQIDDIFHSKDVPIWDVSLGYDDSRPADKEDIMDVVDTLDSTAQED